jgi:hypothetical protein
MSEEEKGRMRLINEADNNDIMERFNRAYVAALAPQDLDCILNLPARLAVALKRERLI